MPAARVVVALIAAAVVVAAALLTTGIGAAGVVATLCLGAATVWLGWQSRRAIQQAADFRAQEATDRREGRLRAALLEQLDECRLWQRWNPDLKEGDWSQKILQQHEPGSDKLRSLLASEAVDAQCRDRLLWRVDDLENWVAEHRTEWTVSEIPVVMDGGHWGSEWTQQLDHHVEIVRLLLGCAENWKLDGLVREFDGNRWLEPPPGTLGLPSSEDQDIAQGLPPWPSAGAFARWSPAAWSDRLQKASAARRSATIDAAPHGRTEGGPSDVIQ